jgi:Transposase, Mutator family
VQLIISDACLGLAESAAEFFPEARWQRCIVGSLKKWVLGSSLCDCRSVHAAPLVRVGRRCRDREWVIEPTSAPLALRERPPAASN